MILFRVSALIFVSLMVLASSLLVYGNYVPIDSSEVKTEISEVNSDSLMYKETIPAPGNANDRIPFVVGAVDANSMVSSTGEPSVCNTGQAECGEDTSMGLGNPAAMYCKEMGYEYQTVKTQAGEQGICVLPNGEEVDAWAFYRGECAPEFSYCAKMGWPIASASMGDSYSARSCTCVLPDGSRQTVSELLDLGAGSAVAIDSLGQTGTDEGDIEKTVGILPDSFDWRIKEGQDWMTPVKDQAGCGSCWAFGAVGAVEPQYNIINGNATLDLDLAEQYLVSDCCTQCGSCGGGWHGTALEFVRDEGITDEDCFPYTATNRPCSDRCSDWSSRLYKIDDTGSVSNNMTLIKEYLIEQGPLSVGIKMGGYFDDGIYRCEDDSGINHSVVIAGYNATAEYWVVKNSWGSGWNDEGYFNVGFGECSIENYVYYAALYPWPILLSPADGLAVQPGEIVFQWQDEEGATGYHMQIDSVDTFDSPDLVEVDTIGNWYAHTLSLGTYYWRVMAHLDGEDTPYSPPWAVTAAEPVVQVTTDPGSDYYPSITQSEDGTIWMVWQSYRSGGRHIWYKTSSDNGSTWSAASPVDTGIWGYQPSITQTSDGKIWVAFYSHESGNSDIWYTTTSDGGATWSEASQVTTDLGSDYDPTITQTSDGTIWMVWESYRSGNYDIWYKTSSDGGATWSVASQLTTDPDSDYDPTITQTDDGKIWVVWQSYRPGGNGIWYKTSSDGGATWSEASPVDTGTWSNQPAIAQTNDGTIWVAFYSWEAGNADIWYTTTSDGGATWSEASQFTRFVGYDYYPAVADLSSGELAMAWRSDRSTNYDIWYGIPGFMEDVNPPPHLNWAENEPAAPETGQTVTVRAWANDESGVDSVHLVWWIDGIPQATLPMYDDGIHDDYGASDGVYGMEVGPFPLIGTVVEYQIQITDVDGNTVLAPQYGYSFEVMKPFVKTASVLLVYDGESGGPGYTGYTHYYTDALDNAGYAYDVWSTDLRGNIDGETINQYLDGIVIWAVPEWGYINWWETQNNLTSYLENGGRLFISGQNIGDMMGQTDFYQDYLHAQYVQNNIGLFALLGVSGDPITDGLYVSISGDYGANNQYSPSEIDPISPAEVIFTYEPSAAAPLSVLEEPHLVTLPKEGQSPLDETDREIEPGTTITLSSGSGALRVDTGTYKIVYFAFGFEAINNAADRALVMDRVLNWLGVTVIVDPDFEGTPRSCNEPPCCVTFTNLTTGGVPPYQNAVWDFGDGTVIEGVAVNYGETILHCYTDWCNFDVKLTVWDADGTEAHQIEFDYITVGQCTPLLCWGDVTLDEAPALEGTTVDIYVGTDTTPSGSGTVATAGQYVVQVWADDSRYGEALTYKVNGFIADKLGPGAGVFGLQNQIVDLAAISQSEAITSFILGLDTDDCAGGNLSIREANDPITGDPVLIGGYEAEFTYDGSLLDVLEVRLKPPFDTGISNIDDPSGLAQFNGIAAAGAPAPVDLAFLPMRLVGCALDQCQGTLSFTSIVDVDGYPLGISPPEIGYSFQRGDARADGNVNIADALFIAQYLVGVRDLGDGLDKVHAVNAAAVKHDNGCDEIDIADVLFIAQYLVGIRDCYFEMMP